MWSAIATRTDKPRAAAESMSLPYPIESEKLGLLAAMDIFADLSHDELEALMSSAPMRTAKRGAVFYGAEDGPEVLFLLKSGRVELYRQSQEGKKLTVAIVEPGAIFGEMSLTDQRLVGTSAMAIEDSVICALSRDEVQSLMLKHPSVAFRIIEVLARRLHQTTDALEHLAFNDVTGRVANLLVQLADPDTNVIEGYSHQNLASMVGCLRESLTVTLDRFKDTGALEIGRKRIQIIDLPKLERVLDQRRS